MPWPRMEGGGFLRPFSRRLRTLTRRARLRILSTALAQRLLVVARACAAVRAAATRTGATIRRNWKNVLLFVAWYALFDSALLIPVDALANSVRAILLFLLVMKLYDWYMRLQREALGNARKEAKSHLSVVESYRGLFEEATQIAREHEASGDREKEREWKYRAADFVLRLDEAHASSQRAADSRIEEAERTRLFAFLAGVALYLGLLAAFGISFS